jgi:hypothetical protein
VDKYYLKYGKASDAGNKSDYRIYRFFEVLPGALAWATFAGIILASWRFPVAASFFIISFDTYWFLKTLFLSVHLRAAYGKMKVNLKIDWLRKLDEESVKNSELNIADWREVYHLTILPFYKEPYEIVREAIVSIIKSNYPKEKLIVVLGVEERAGGEAAEIAMRLKEEFQNSFFKFLVAIHPSGIPGEIAGKGSNETWAVKEAKEKIIDPARIPYEKIIVSSLDTDTKVYPDYFAIVTWHYLTSPKPLRSSFQPIPIYNNNIWDAPFFSRVVATSGTFWQMMQQARPERLTTFSSHSMPFKSLVEMNYWHTNIVSEDSRIFWQSLLFYDGDWRTIPLYYPVSLDANVGLNLWETAKNVYKQQRRWGWGVENVPYTLFGFIKNKKIPLTKKIFFSFIQLEGFWSWATNAVMIFFLGWLPVVLGGSQFGTSVLSYNLPRITRYLMTFSMFGLVTSAILSTVLLPPRPPHKRKTVFLWMFLQWLMLPLTIIFFGSIPGIDAQTRLMLGKYMGFWVTPKHRRYPET